MVYGLSDIHEESGIYVVEGIGLSQIRQKWDRNVLREADSGS